MHVLKHAIAIDGIAAATSLAMLAALLGVSAVMENLVVDNDDRENSPRSATQGKSQQDWIAE